MAERKGDAVSRPFYLALCGLIALAVAMGVGRFAFTPLLPLMQADAGLTLTGGSWLAFANYLGYLIGALATVWLPARPSLMVRGGLVATGVLTLAMGLVHGFGLWWTLRFASGIASAFVLVHAASMTLERLTLAGSPQSFGVVFGGVGTGITLTGLACLAMVSAGFESASIWLGFGVASLVLSALCWPAFGASPAEAKAGAGAGPAKGGWGPAAWTLIIAYGLYGFGYIIPGTFMPVIARDLLGGAFASGWFWPMFGAAALAGTLLLGRITGAGVHRALVGCFFTEALGVIIPVLVPNAVGLALGSLLLGSAFVAITLLTLRRAQAHAAASQTDAAPLMGALTASFGLGQLIGPPLAGYLVVWLGGFGPSLCVAAAALAAGGAALWIIGR
jgi:MFS family permease